MHVYLPYSDFNWFPFASLDRCCLPCNWQVWRSRNFGRRSERCMRRCEADRSITWRLLLLLLLLVELQFFFNLFNHIPKDTAYFHPFSTSISRQVLFDTKMVPLSMCRGLQLLQLASGALILVLEPRLPRLDMEFIIYSIYFIYLLVRAARWCHMTHQGWDCWCR